MVKKIKIVFLILIFLLAAIFSSYVFYKYNHLSKYAGVWKVIQIDSDNYPPRFIEGGEDGEPFISQVYLKVEFNLLGQLDHFFTEDVANTEKYASSSKGMFSRPYYDTFFVKDLNDRLLYERTRAIDASAWSKDECFDCLDYYFMREITTIVFENDKVGEFKRFWVFSEYGKSCPEHCPEKWLGTYKGKIEKITD